ncbi:GntR family transcriptional regulator [Bradyrhizobium sp. RDM4]|uniref:GntR family transcriptional regulator n=1 Tax=Bradyrhizobium sp. RDM4 TaxID=3378765 RepID=UPI0038FC6502
MNRFEYPSMSDRTPVIAEGVRNLRDRIMVGELRPGQKLVEAELCQELEVSRASIREILRILASEQLIKLIPNRGAFVAELHLKDIEDIHEVWAMLTGRAVQLCSATASTQLVRDLEAITKEVAKAAKRRDPMEQLDATNKFFAAITSSCGNRVLMDSVYALVSRINFLRAQAYKDRDWTQECARGISEILEKIRQRKPKDAQAALDRHIDVACAAAKKAVLNDPSSISV